MGLAFFRCCAWGWRAHRYTRSQACELASSYLGEAKRRPSALAHIVAAQINLYDGRYDAALTDAARAIALDPNDPEAHIVMAWVMVRTGKPQTGLEFIHSAMRLDPSYPSHYALARGTALFATGALDEAARVLEEALKRRPNAIELAPMLAATYAQLGRRPEARDLLLRWQPGASQEQLSDIPFAYPFVGQWSTDGQEAADRLVDGLIIAALPLDVTIAGLAGALGPGNKFSARTQQECWAGLALRPRTPCRP